LPFIFCCTIAPLPEARKPAWLKLMTVSNPKPSADVSRPPIGGIVWTVTLNAVVPVLPNPADCLSACVAGIDHLPDRAGGNNRLGHDMGICVRRTSSGANHEAVSKSRKRLQMSSIVGSKSVRPRFGDFGDERPH
jgi:hypothetical protein